MKMKAVNDKGNAMFIFFGSAILKINVYGVCILAVVTKLVC